MRKFFIWYCVAVVVGSSLMSWRAMSGSSQQSSGTGLRSWGSSPSFGGFSGGHK